MIWRCQDLPGLCRVSLSVNVAFEILQTYCVTHSFIFPTALKAMMKAFPKPRKQFNLRLQGMMSAGEAVGYGGTWVSQRPTTLGLIPVGYGDGYPRHIAKNTLIWVNGQYAPIVGRVSMDMLTVDLTDCSVVQAGDNVELWGAHVSIDDVARSAGTIAYELLCQVTNRVR